MMVRVVGVGRQESLPVVLVKGGGEENDDDGGGVIVYSLLDIQ